ncbi:DUF2516 family protein [Paenarthrobacter sp. DKR-5]|uniref:DUF2516 family protein n=1 Tax=Paenarthrobacter sp. DKR-5 TaxID=2835535 RepID=UPI0027DDB93B|nr:DUF2516 family protein [Paenarthrobacter sp. DKR-5]
MLINLVTYWVYLLLTLVCSAIEVWALVHCLSTRSLDFQRAFKRTKGFWGGLTAAAVVAGFLTNPRPIGLDVLPLFFQLAAVTAAGVYLADVRPAVQEARRGGRGSQGPYGPW